MPKRSTSLRLLLLAVATSFALTSCFGHDKKDDPKPKGACGTKTTTTTASGCYSGVSAPGFSSHTSGCW
jgi:hypothetical protein